MTRVDSNGGELFWCHGKIHKFFFLETKFRYFEDLAKIRRN